MHGGGDRSGVTPTDAACDRCDPEGRPHGLRAARTRRRRLRGRAGRAGWSSPATRSSAARPLLEVMTDKATMEVPSPFAGTIDRAAAPSRGSRSRSARSSSPTTAGGQAAPPRQPRRRDRRPPRRQSPRRNGRDGQRAAGDGRLPVKAAPSVRYMARKLGIDLAHGPRQRARRAASWSRTCTPAAAAADRPRQPRTRGAAARLRQARHAHQAAGPAPQDRRAHGAGEAHHPALQLRR